MSKWITISDSENVGIATDGETLDICYSRDDFGNNYVEVPIEMIIKKLKEAGEI